MAMPTAPIAGKSAFIKLSERIEGEVIRLPQSVRAEPAFREEVTQVNEWLGAADQLVFAQRAAAVEVEQVLERRLSGRELVTAAAVCRRFPVVAEAQPAPVQASWEPVVVEEIRVE